MNPTIYTEVDNLILELKKQKCELLANILDHRLHRVAWTSGSELREELRKVLAKADCSDPILTKKIKIISDKL
jgi:hypothetical protein